MDFLRNFFSTIKPSAKRFSVALVLSITGCIAESICLLHDGVFKWENILTAITMSSIWCSALSICTEITFELAVKIYNPSNKIKLLIHGAEYKFILGMLIFWTCLLNEDSISQYKRLAYFGTLSSLFFILIFLSKITFKDKNIPGKFVISSVFTLIVSTCIGTGVFIVYSAIAKLILGEMPDYKISETIWLWTALGIAYNIFIAFFFKDEQNLSESKPIRILFEKILLPIYALLLVVLYIYFFKCVFTKKLPSGEINWFVSFATVFYIEFFHALKTFKSRTTDVFYKACPVLLLPLIAIQYIAFFIRVNAYGYTESRYLSVIYIILSTIFVAITIYRKKDFTTFVILLFAVMALAVAVGPFNMIDTPKRNQLHIFEKILAKYNMLDGENIILNSQECNFSDDDKAKILSSFKEIDLWEKKPSWIKEYFENEDSFEKILGFNPISTSSKRNYSKHFEITTKDYVFDVKNFSELSEICISSNQTEKFYASENGKKKEKIVNMLDIAKCISEKTRAYEAENGKKFEMKEPFIFEKEGFTFILTKVTLFYTEDTLEDFYFSGFACR